MEEFHYKVPWRGGLHHPGLHRGVQIGVGNDFYREVPLAQATDPRRLDLRATLRDPFEEIKARAYRQHNAVPVYQIADLSASMRFGRKSRILRDFTAALGYSSYRTGDPFGFIGCDRVLREDFYFPASRARERGYEISERLGAFRDWGDSSAGLADAAERIGGRRSLVFLTSDFLFPPRLLERILELMSMHTVVPVVIGDTGEHRGLPGFGLVRLRDSETGRARLLLLRGSLRQRVVEEFAARRQQLLTLCMRYAAPPLFLADRFRAQDVTRHFYAQ